MLQHLDTPRSYVQMLFLDYSSAFDTFISGLLYEKLGGKSTLTFLSANLKDQRMLELVGLPPVHSHRLPVRPKDVSYHLYFSPFLLMIMYHTRGGSRHFERGVYKSLGQGPEPRVGGPGGRSPPGEKGFQQF